jgi:hypothetical protein
MNQGGFLIRVDLIGEQANAAGSLLRGAEGQPCGIAQNFVEQVRYCRVDGG